MKNFKEILAVIFLAAIYSSTNFNQPKDGNKMTRFQRMKTYLLGNTPWFVVGVLITLLSIESCKGQNMSYTMGPDMETPTVNFDISKEIKDGVKWEKENGVKVWDWISDEERDQFPSVVRLYIKHGVGVSSGSGTFFKRQGDLYALLTAAHVISEMESPLPFFPQAPSQFNLNDMALQFDDGTVRRIDVQHSLINTNFDVAVIWLRIKDAPEIRLSKIASAFDPDAKHVGMGYGTQRVLRAFNILLKRWSTKMEVYAEQILIKGDSGGPIFNRETKQQVGIIKAGWLQIPKDKKFMTPLVWPAAATGIEPMLSAQLAMEQSLDQIREMQERPKLESPPVQTLEPYSPNLTPPTIWEGSYGTWPRSQNPKSCDCVPQR